MTEKAIQGQSGGGEALVIPGREKSDFPTSYNQPRKAPGKGKKQQRPGGPREGGF